MARSGSEIPQLWLLAAVAEIRLPQLEIWDGSPWLLSRNEVSSMRRTLFLLKHQLHRSVMFLATFAVPTLASPTGCSSLFA